VNDRLDEFDLKLLDAVQRNNRLTAEQLAEKVCLSSSAVQRRFNDSVNAKLSRLKWQSFHSGRWAEV